mgnify:CR=1 FL=1|tara:strand:+ start:2994 stop:4013 length:1020 start_codon:yes stop_codon:yes gene_type:complete
MNKLILLVLVPLFSWGQVASFGEETIKLKYTNSILVEDLKKHLYILASDSLEGRETGELGQKRAAEYIAKCFKKVGIPPYKCKTYYQKFKVKSKGHLRQRIILKQKHVKGENVLGFIEGKDLKDEVLIITAHYDHLGKKKSLIYNGADDNASGTSAILEIAEAFMKAKKDSVGPRRSILIMAVSGEEKGLLGSKYYTENPIYPLEKTVANLNVDMIGRVDEHHENGDYVYLIGSDRLSTELHNISEEVNRENFNIELDYTFNDKDDPNRYYYRSDHYNFAKNNIPVIFYFNGTHEDYHKPTDTRDKIDFEKLQKISRLIFLTAWELANRNERPAIDVLN